MSRRAPLSRGGDEPAVPTLGRRLSSRWGMVALASRGSLTALAVATLAVAAARAVGLWLIVVGAFSAVVVLARERLLARRRLPVRLATWALHAPLGPSPPVALENAIAADLAVMSEGHLDRLDRAQAVVGECVDDPWRRALAVERLTMAGNLIEGGRLVGVTARRQRSATRLRRSAPAVAMIVLLALGYMTQSRWWLLPLAAAHALLTLECLDLHQCRRAVPELLASRSLQDPIGGLFVMPEQEVAHSLVVLAGKDPGIIQRALRLLDQTDASDDTHARLRLVHAECLAGSESDAGRRKRG